MSGMQAVLEQVSVERIREHIRNLEGMRHPLSAPEALEQAAQYIEGNLQDFGFTVVRQPFEYAGKEYYNLIANQPGLHLPDEHLMVLAHYDSELETPGANDNASGVAAVLELARLFHGLQFERSIQFIAVNLEEWQGTGSLDSNGLLGSRALAAHTRAMNINLLGVINFETIACAGDDIPQKTPENLPIPLPEKGNFIGVIGNQASAGLVQGYMQAIQRYQIDLPAVPLVVPGSGEMLRDTRRSDHARFWDVGYPAIMLTDTANFRSDLYHRPGDTLDTLNLEFCRKVCMAGGGLVAALAGRLGGL